MTRGALYHHFKNKQDLFEAAFEELEARVVERVLSAALAQTDPWSQAVVGIDAFLEACLEPRHRRLALQEAPLALGWKRWREINDRHFVGLLRTSLETLVASRAIKPQPLEMLTRVLFVALCEAAITAADAPDAAVGRRDATSSSATCSPASGSGLAVTVRAS